MPLHFFQKIFGYGISRALADDRIDIAIGAKRGRIGIYPLCYFIGLENFEAVKAAAQRIVFENFPVAGAIGMSGGNRIFHKISPKVYP